MPAIKRGALCLVACTLALAARHALTLRHDATLRCLTEQGAIVLATGGDQSNGASGNFYEGFMTAGYASEATDAAVQANIVAVGYSGWNRPR